MFSTRVYCILCFIYMMYSGVCFEYPGFDTIQKNLMTWDIQFKRIENCKNPGNGDIDLDIRLKRISRTRIDMVGNITLNVELGDNIKTVFDLSMWGNGGWRNNAHRFTVQNSCSGDSVFAIFLTKARKILGMPLHTCPIPAKRYELKSFDTQIINNISLPLYVTPTLWKITFSYFEKASNKCLSCKAFIVESRVKSMKKKD